MSDQQLSDPRTEVCKVLRELLTELMARNTISPDVLQHFREQVPITSRAFGRHPDAQRYMGEIEEMAEELVSNPSPKRKVELVKSISRHNPQMRNDLLKFCSKSSDPLMTQNEESTP